MAEITSERRVMNIGHETGALKKPRKSDSPAASFRPSGFVLPKAIDAAGIAIAILRDDGYITYQNEPCECILAASTSALFILNGELRAKRRSDLRTLQDALIKASRDNKPTAFRLQSLDEDKSLEILVSSLSTRSGDDHHSVVIMRHPADIFPAPELLSQLYDLTPAEAGLAEALVRGEGLAKACEVRGITVNTGKGYLKRIFQKTGTSRQSELSAKVLGGVAAFSQAALPCMELRQTG